MAITKKTLVSLGTALTIIGGGGYKLGTTDTQVETLVRGNERIVSKLDKIAERLARLTGEIERHHGRDSDYEEASSTPRSRPALSAGNKGACHRRPLAPSAQFPSSRGDLRELYQSLLPERAG